MQAELNRGITTPSKLMAGALDSPLSVSSNAGSDTIKSFRPTNHIASKIPNSPALTPAQKILKKQGLFASPLPTPSALGFNDAREEALKHVLAELESLMTKERSARAAVMKKVEQQQHTKKAGDENIIQQLTAQAAVHLDRITHLSEKLSRTRAILKDLQQAHKSYQDSAQKVQSAETRLQAKEHETAQGKATGRRVSVSGTTKLRRELNEATSMMSTAFKRVEDIERITDDLMRQLNSVEAELAEVQAARLEESTAHANEIERLNKERYQLMDQLEGVSRRTAELEAHDAELKKELMATAVQAEQLAFEVASTSRAMTDAEARMVAERRSLALELEKAREREEALCAGLEQNQVLLAEALDKAAQGTPVGRGAKIVLPMALRRIKETQEALRVEEDRKAAVEARLAQTIADGKAREASLKMKMGEVESEKERQVAEKQASLETMTRAVAAATQQAAVKQEAINKLTTEMDALNCEREELQHELQDSMHRCFELEAQLGQVQSDVADACADGEAAMAVAATLQEQLSVALADRTNLAAHLEANREQCSALEASVMAMKARLEAETAAAAEAVHALANANATTAHTKLQLAKAVEEQSKLREQLRDQEGAIAELTTRLGAAHATVHDLNGRVQCSQEAASVQQAEWQRAATTMKAQLDQALAHRDELQGSIEQLQARVMVLADEKRVAEGAVVAAQDTGAALAESLKGQLDAAVAAQSDLLAQRQHLQERLANQTCRVEELATALKARTSAFAAKEVEMQTLAKLAADQAHALSSQLSRVCEERDAMEGHRARLERDLDQLAEALQEKENEVGKARTQGTPKGEGAKHVLKLAFEKIHALKSAVAGAQKTVAERDGKIAAMQEALRAHEEESNRLQGRMEAASISAEARITELRRQLAEEHETRSDIERMNAELAPQVERLVEQLESAIEETKVTKEALVTMTEAKARVETESAELRADLAQLRFEHATKLQQAKREKEVADTVATNVQQALVDANAQGGALRADLAELRYTASRKEAANKEVMLRTFDRIRDLQAVVVWQEEEMELRGATVTALEGMLECAQENAMELASVLTDKNALLEAVKKDSEELEGAMCRLRVDVQVQLEERLNAEERVKRLEKEVDGLQSSIERRAVEAARAEEEAKRVAGEEVVALKQQLAHVMQELHQAREEWEAKERAFVEGQQEGVGEKKALQAVAAEMEREIAVKNAMIQDLRVKESTLLKMKEERVHSEDQIKELKSSLATHHAKIEELITVVAEKTTTVDELKARINQLQSQQTTRIHELQDQMGEKCALIQELTEALDLQRQTVATAAQVHALRQADLARALCHVEQRLAELQKKSAEELQVAKIQMRALMKENEELTVENSASCTAAQHGLEMQKELEVLRKKMGQYDAMERANAELCAQLGAMTAERRAEKECMAKTNAASSVSTSTSAEQGPRSHRTELVESPQRPERGMHQQQQQEHHHHRAGRTWGAVVAAVLAIFWSATAVGASSSTTSTTAPVNVYPMDLMFE